MPTKRYSFFRNNATINGLNILLIESDLEHIGGNETMAFAVARGLAEKGHNIFLAFKISGNILTENREFIAKIHQADLECFNRHRFLLSLKTLFLLFSLTRLWKIDLVFSSHLGFLRTLALLKLIGNTPFVYHLGLGPPKKTFLSTWAIKSMSFGVLPSPQNLSAWRKAGLKKEQVVVIPNWIDLNRFHPVKNKLLNRGKLKLDKAKSWILFLGRVVPEKGVEILLKAFAALSRQEPDIMLAIVGPLTSSYKSHLNLLCHDLNLSIDRIKLIGAVRNTEDYLATADMTVVPSIAAESFGLTAVESMACGVLT